LITVVGPVSPEGAFTTGTLVAEGITMNGFPEIMVALAPGMTSGGAGEAMFIGEDTITGIPSISDVFPGRPGGAVDAGMVVGLGVTTLTPDRDATLLTGRSLVGQLPMTRQMASAIDLSWSAEAPTESDGF